MIRFVLSWLPWTSKLFMLHKTRVAIRFRAKKPSPQTTRHFALVCLWCGRTAGWLVSCHVIVKFLGWVVYHYCLSHIFLPISYPRESSAKRSLKKYKRKVNGRNKSKNHSFQFFGGKIFIFIIQSAKGDFLFLQHHMKLVYYSHLTHYPGRYQTTINSRKWMRHCPGKMVVLTHE